MTQNDDYSVNGRRIRGYRQRKMWRQEDLAREAGVQAGSVSRIETGVHRPQLRTVGKIAKALGVDPDDLIEWHIEL
jgi:transcriptional regulator with XRE-family HTH domain